MSFRENPDVDINYYFQTYNNDGTESSYIGGNIGNYHESVPPVSGTASGTTATANPGYWFLGWFEDNDINKPVESTSFDNRIIVPKPDGVYHNADYWARFIEWPDAVIDYTVKTTNKDGVEILNTGGYVDPSQECVPPATGDSKGSLPHANPGFSFVNWTDSEGNEVACDASGVITVPKTIEGLYESGIYTANFKENPDVKITFDPKTENKISDRGGLTYKTYNIVAPVTGIAKSIAFVNPGYHFYGWIDASDELIDGYEEEQCFIAPKNDMGIYEDASYFAHFEEDNPITITYNSKIENEFISNSCSVDLTDEVLAPATGKPLGSVAQEADGYEFINWTDKDGNIVSTDKYYVPEKVIAYRKNPIKKENDSNLILNNILPSLAFADDTDQSGSIDDDEIQINKILSEQFLLNEEATYTANFKKLDSSDSLIKTDDINWLLVYITGALGLVSVIIIVIHLIRKKQK